MHPESSIVEAQTRTDKTPKAKGRKPVATNRFAERLLKTLQKGHSVDTCLHRLRTEGWTRHPS